MEVARNLDTSQLSDVAAKCPDDTEEPLGTETRPTTFKSLFWNFMNIAREPFRSMTIEDAWLTRRIVRISDS